MWVWQADGEGRVNLTHMESLKIQPHLNEWTVTGHPREPNNPPYQLFVGDREGCVEYLRCIADGMDPLDDVHGTG